MAENNLLNTCFRKTDNVVFRKIAGESVCVPIHKDAVDLESLFSFNETAARIWELIDGNRTADEIIKIVSSEYDIAQDDIKNDLVHFFLQLKDLDFVKEAD